MAISVSISLPAPPWCLPTPYPKKPGLLTISVEGVWSKIITSYSSPAPARPPSHHAFSVCSVLPEDGDRPAAGLLDLQSSISLSCRMYAHHTWPA